MYIPQRFDFVEKFDQPVFEGRANRNVQYANGTMKDNHYGTPILEELVQDSGCMDP